MIHFVLDDAGIDAVKFFDVFVNLSVERYLMVQFWRLAEKLVEVMVCQRTIGA